MPPRKTTTVSLAPKGRAAIARGKQSQAPASTAIPDQKHDEHLVFIPSTTGKVALAVDYAPGNTYDISSITIYRTSLLETLYVVNPAACTRSRSGQPFGHGFDCSSGFCAPKISSAMSRRSTISCARQDVGSCLPLTNLATKRQAKDRLSYLAQRARQRRNNSRAYERCHAPYAWPEQATTARRTTDGCAEHATITTESGTNSMPNEGRHVLELVLKHDAYWTVCTSVMNAQSLCRPKEDFPTKKDLDAFLYPACRVSGRAKT